MIIGEQCQQLESLLTSFYAIFQPLVDMPPARMQDHRIPLKQGTSPIAVKPYRYPHFQKNEIERQVKELLKSGTIQPTSSPHFLSSTIGEEERWYLEDVH